MYVIIMPPVPKGLVTTAIRTAEGIGLQSVLIRGVLLRYES